MFTLDLESRDLLGEKAELKIHSVVYTRMTQSINFELPPGFQRPGQSARSNLLLTSPQKDLTC